MADRARKRSISLGFLYLFPITILGGLLSRTQIHLADRKVNVSAGQLLVLDCGVLLDVETLEESALLLTISWRSEKSDRSESFSSTQRHSDEEALSRMDDEGGVPDGVVNLAVSATKAGPDQLDIFKSLPVVALQQKLASLVLTVHHLYAPYVVKEVAKRSRSQAFGRTARPESSTPHHRQSVCMRRITFKRQSRIKESVNFAQNDSNPTTFELRSRPERLCQCSGLPGVSSMLR